MRRNLVMFLITILVLAVLTFSFLPREETAGLPEDLQGADALALLTEATKQGQADILAELAQRMDAMGFAANLALAQIEENPVEHMRQALALYESTDVRLQLAEYLAEKKDEGAVAEYQALLPDSEAIGALGGLGESTASILEVLSAGQHWQGMVAFLEGSDGSLTKNENIYLVQALVNLGQYEQVQPILSELIQQLPENDTLQWQYARALEAMGQTEEALELYRQLGHVGRQRLGRLYEQQGLTTMAAEAYGESQEPAALWRGAVLWDELGVWEEALPLYLLLTKEPGSYQDDALYRSYQLMKDVDDQHADLLLSQLASHPVWMSRLGLTPSWPVLKHRKWGESPLLQRIDAYRAADRSDLITVELAIAWESASPQDKISLGEWYLERGDYRQASRWGVGALRDQPDERRAYELAYPRPYTKEVKEAALEFDLEPGLIWAVMREESRYQPAVASSAGAQGLMQVMPATGQEIAASLGTEYSKECLIEPAVNIRFGAYYLRAMLNRYDNDIDRALAAYNGGPGNVNRWIKSDLGATPAGFPTAVPFFETRQYITKVQDSYLTYQWLYDE